MYIIIKIMFRLISNIKNRNISLKHYSTINHRRPIDYNNYHFWIKQLFDSNNYAFGIKNKFIYEYGNIDYMNINVDSFSLLNYNSKFGDIECDKLVCDLDAPFDYSIIIKNDKLCFNEINNNPEHIDNSLCIIKDISEFKLYEKNNNKKLNDLYFMPLL